MARRAQNNLKTARGQKKMAHPWPRGLLKVSVGLCATTYKKKLSKLNVEKDEKIQIRQDMSGRIDCSLRTSQIETKRNPCFLKRPKM